MGKYLVINADDFGLSKSVNQGIVELYEKGIVTSTSLLVNMPGFKDAVEIAARFYNLSVGLHFNLTYGYPVSKSCNVKSLVNQHGKFSGHFFQWKEDDVRKELYAQWNYFLANGMNPTHLDSHQHIHTYKAVYRPMVELAHDKNLPMRKVGWEPNIGIQHPKTANRCILDEYFNGDGLVRLKKHLMEVGDGVTELMCHPGYVDDDLAANCSWTNVRETELHVLIHPDVLSVIQQYQIQLIHYGQLFEKNIL